MNFKQDESKKKILEAAKQCFADNGYDQTSVRKICEVANVNLALVSYYYGSKEKLYLAVIEHLSQDAIEQLNWELAVEKPEKALYQFIQVFLSSRKNNKHFQMIIKHELSSDQERGKAISSLIAPYFHYLRHVLVEGKKQGLFHYESLNHLLVYISSVLVYPAFDSLIFEFFPVHDESLDEAIHHAHQFIRSALNAK